MILGSMVALVTPMDKSGVVDWIALSKLLEWHIDEGTSAIIAMGTTGESATLDEQEHCEVIIRTVENVNGRIPVIAGTGSNSTTEAISLTHCAKEAGADACLLVTPYYNKPTQEGLYQHYAAIANAVDIPQILYNVPSRTACDLLPDTIGRLSELNNIVGVKEATGELDRVAQIAHLCGEDFAIYSGDDATTLEFLAAGGHGVISVTANVAPGLMQKMCQAVLGGELDEAKALDEGLRALHRDLFVEANPIPVKWALSDMGLIEEGIRLPLTWLSQRYWGTVHSALKIASII
jgi:4-hydroxy-tetrahydrodipicolinate synthase